MPVAGLFLKRLDFEKILKTVLKRFSKRKEFS